MSISNGPESENGSSAISGKSSAPLNVPAPEKRISIGWHYQYGWLRRPELDEVGQGYAYEEPDGDLVYVNLRKAKKRVMLQCRETEKGERYLCLYHK